MWDCSVDENTKRTLGKSLTLSHVHFHFHYRLSITIRHLKSWQINAFDILTGLFTDV